MNDTPYSEKRKQLLHIMQEYARQDVMVAFSGGADSSLLLQIACEQAKKYGTQVYAITIQTALHPVTEATEAKQAAEAMGAIHHIIKANELAEAGIENNPTDRCYRCKHYMFSKVKALAAELQVPTIMEGTNSDDLQQYRPGLLAIKELGLKSPLAEANFTKAQVRKMAAEYKLAAAEKPSAPCLATRFPYGTKLTYGEMQRVDAIENTLHTMGFYNVRARIHGDLVRLEVDAEAIPQLAARRQEIIRLVKAQGYAYVCADLEGFRSGSQDIHIAIKNGQNFS